MSPLDWLLGFWSFLVSLLVPYTLDMRTASMFVIVVATLFNLASMGLNKLFINVEEQREYMQVVSEYRSLLKEAKLSGDKKLQAKLRKREAAMRTLGGKTAKQQMKMTLISLALFWFFFTLIGNAFQTRPAALLPLSFDPSAAYVELPMFYWYLISSIAISRPLSKIVGLPMGLGLPGTQPTTATPRERPTSKPSGKPAGKPMGKRAGRP
ncbi:MAG: EMC3/TMCO1 family protein [Candidatus Bathyarchaeia archaeon]